jgi:transposase
MLMPTPTRILVATQPVDFRLSIDGLAALVELQLKDNPLSGTMFVFLNKRRRGLKLLVWDHGGFVLLYKKLERGRFRLPASEHDRLSISAAELLAILEGIDLAGAERLPRWNPSQTTLASPRDCDR